jgi:fatty-acyl-CoA synthase
MIWDALTGASRSMLHCWDGERFTSAAWGEVVRDAVAMTGGLHNAGVRPGRRVATVLTNSPETVRGVLGTWLAGGTIASLPIPARGMDLDEYGAHLVALTRHVGADTFLFDERVAGLIPDELHRHATVRSWRSVTDRGGIDPAPPGADEIAFIQYSSGSTGAPKGCILTTRAITRQCEMVVEMLAGRPGVDCCASWLPLSHDMGIFGCLLTPWAYDFDLVLSSPERFLFAPRTWFGDMAQFGATLTAGTNTGLYLGARAYASTPLPGPLRLETCIIGAEPIDSNTLDFAQRVFGAQGLRPETLMPAYGLAEATLAVTAMPVAEAPRRLHVDPGALAAGEIALAGQDESATALVSCGVPCRGVELHGLERDRLAELHVRSPSLASGYWGDPVRTAERFTGGSLATGDLGFVRDGHFYAVGRNDDMISHAGRNIYVRQIETLVETLEPVRRGGATMVDMREGGATRLVLLAELSGRLDDYRRLSERAAGFAMAKAGVALDECVFLERGSLPKTPSGKIQRHRCRAMLRDARLAPLAIETFTPLRGQRR